MDFSFPYEPYDIQLRLMEAIEKCIEDGKVGIFESPTGTGKSLSVLCSSLTWLENNEKSIEDKLTMLAKSSEKSKVSESGNDDWIEAYRNKKQQDDKANEAKESLERIQKVKDKVLMARDRMKEVNSKKRKHLEDGERKPEREEDELAPPDVYVSDEDDVLDEEPTELQCTKIFYASRTHSQLEQIVDELGKTRFKPRIVTIGSRQNLCNNEDVKKLKASHLINERCMELRKKKASSKKQKGEAKTTSSCSSNGCSYYKSDAIEDLSDEIIAGRLIRPSEVVNRGQSSVACSYFASRKSVPLCQLVLLPYQVLLHSATREAWGIKLDGNVVILDEAHNVLSTIGNIYSTELDRSALVVAQNLIREYVDTYRSRLKAKNLVYMRQLLTVVECLLRYINVDGPVKEEVKTIPAFVDLMHLTEINMFKLVHYMESTDLCRKFHGFFVRSKNKENIIIKETKKASGVSKLLAKKEEVPKQQEPQPSTSTEKPVASPLFAIKSFLESLNNPCEDGRIIIDKLVYKYKFLLLNPADRLCEVVREARATVMVGGTMEPADLLMECLSRGGNKVERFSCKHVIDDHQLLSLAVGFTCEEKPFTLDFEGRSDVSTIKALGTSWISLLETIPNGCVAFFASYDYMDQFFKILQRFDLLDKIKAKKVLYVETRGASSDDLFAKFQTSAKTSRGALMCAVVGGKLSEGINFSDELGRAVFMFGLPYPNRYDKELTQKMKYLDTKISGGGQQLYNSLCMHAVNQAVGRAIRHRNDYAAVFLMDSRFSSTSIKKQLSGWIANALKTPKSFKETVEMSSNFFKNVVIPQR